MNSNFFEEGVDIRTISFDNPDYDNLDKNNLGHLEIKETIYIKVSRWFLYIGIFLLPLFFLPWTSSILELNKQLLLLVLAGGALILWLLHVVISGQLPWRSNPLDKGVAALLVAVSLSTIFSLARFKSLFGLTGSLSDSLTTVLALSIFYFGIVNVFDDKGNRIRTILGYSLFFITKATAFGKYINMAGIFLALVILLILNWWVLWAVAMVGMVTTIALDSLNNPGFKISKFLLPMTIIVLGVFMMVVNLNLNFLKKDFSVEVAPSFSLSIDIAQSVMRKNMVFGYGPENFSLAFDKYGAGKLVNTTLSGAKFFDSMSQVFNWAIQGGLVMLAAFIFLLWLMGWSIFKYLNISKLKDGDIGIMSGVAALIMGMFLYPFNLALMFVAYVMMGLVALSLWSDNKKVFNVEEKASTSLVSSLGFIGGLILVLVGSYFGVTLYISDVKYVQALTNKDMDKKIDLFAEAINWNGQDDRYYRASSQAALNLLSTGLNKKDNDPNRTAKNQNYVASAINLAKRATEISPRESNNWSNLGDIYQSLMVLVGELDKFAEESYLKAVELRPGDASFYNKIGNMYLAKSDFSRQLAIVGGANASKFQQEIVLDLNKAEENFKKAIDLSNNFGLAIYNLGVVYDRMGKIKEAIGQLERIAPYNSNQPTLAFELGLLYYRDNQKEKAFSQLQRAVLLSPDLSNARWYLGLIYEERQDIPN